MHTPRLSPRSNLPGDDHGGSAIRRNGFHKDETKQSCGDPVWSDRDYVMLACCPKTTQCPSKLLPYYEYCCPGSRDCTAQLSTPTTAQCANSSGSVFEEHGYFCCEDGQVGFNWSEVFWVGRTEGQRRGIPYPVLPERQQPPPLDPPTETGSVIPITEITDTFFGTHSLHTSTITSTAVAQTGTAETHTTITSTTVAQIGTAETHVAYTLTTGTQTGTAETTTNLKPGTATTSSAASSQTSPLNGPGSSANTAAIAGGTAGGVVRGVLIGVGLYWLWGKRRRPKPPVSSEAVSSWGELPGESRKNAVAPGPSELTGSDQAPRVVHATREVLELPAHREGLSSGGVGEPDKSAPGA